MKVLLLNGSPNEKGCTYTALSEIKDVLTEKNIKTNIFHIGNKAVHGCIACGKCTELNRCVFDDDPANEIQSLLHEADGIIVGSPVYYSGPNGALCALLDRVFYSNRESLAHKPAASIVSCRRGGASAAFDRLNKYFTINQMPLVSSQYWNAVHGNSPEEVKKDLEGLQIMRTLGRNMAYMLEMQKESKVSLPEIEEERQRTNFIR